MRLLILALLLTLAGCATTPHDRASRLPSGVLLMHHTVFSAEGSTGDWPAAVRAELEARGYECHPAGCYPPKPEPKP